MKINIMIIVNKLICQKYKIKIYKKEIAYYKNYLDKQNIGAIFLKMCKNSQTIYDELTYFQNYFIIL